MSTELPLHNNSVHQTEGGSLQTWVAQPGMGISGWSINLCHKHRCPKKRTTENIILDGTTALPIRTTFPQASLCCSTQCLCKWPMWNPLMVQSSCWWTEIQVTRSIIHAAGPFSGSINKKAKDWMVTHPKWKWMAHSPAIYSVIDGKILVH